jgi:integrase
MRWQDLSRDTAPNGERAWWWTIPADSTKSARSHRVPLNSEAVRVLDRLRALAVSDTWVFPSPHQGKGSIANPGKAAERLKAVSKVSNLRLHDFRRTAASHMASLGVTRFVIARVLNHAERDVTAVYDRHSYDAEKRAALEAWGRRLVEIVGAGAAPAPGAVA